jgi:hypothetical protein
MAPALYQEPGGKVSPSRGPRYDYGMEWLLELDTWLALCLGIGLAAACGFRVFVPPLVLGIASRLEAPLTSDVPDWIGSWPALIAFATAAVIEIGAFYVPWLDNALDAIATPLAILAGISMTGLALWDLPPLIGWSLAVISGGTMATITQIATVITRALSSGATGGLANFLVATAEAVLSVVVAVIAVLVAPLVLVFVAASIYWLARVIRRRTAARSARLARATA